MCLKFKSIFLKMEVILRNKDQLPKKIKNNGK